MTRLEGEDRDRGRVECEDCLVRLGDRDDVDGGRDEGALRVRRQGFSLLDLASCCGCVECNSACRGFVKDGDLMALKTGILGSSCAAARGCLGCFFPSARVVGDAVSPAASLLA